MKFAEMFMRPCVGASPVLVCAAPARARGLKLESGLQVRGAPLCALDVWAETLSKMPLGEITGMSS